MKRMVLVTLVACAVVGCGGANANGGGGHGPTKSSSGRESPADREARAEQMDKASGSGNRADMARMIDSYLSEYKRQTANIEDKLLTASKIALGEEKARGQSTSDGIGANIAKLKSVGINPKLTANPSFQQGFLVPDGKTYGNELVKVPAAKQTVTRQTFQDFASQETTISFHSYEASQHQLIMHMGAVLVTSAIVRNQKKYGLTTNEEDIMMVRKTLDYARKGDEIAAAGAGLSAGLVAVTNNNKPTKALDDIAKAVKSSLPSKATVTDAEAKAYLEGFEGGLGDAKQRYETMLKTSYGSEWESSTMKSIVDQTFKEADEATHQRSEASRREARNKKANTIVPTNKPDKNDKSGGGAGAGAAAAVASALPSDGPIRSALDVVDALKTGDAKKALGSAMAFVPPGPLKMGLGVALSLFGG